MWYKCSKRGNEQNNLTSSRAIPTHRCTWAPDTPFSLSRSRLQPVPQLPIFFAHIEPLRHKEEIARSREAPLPCFACMMPFTGDKQNAMKEQNCSHAGIGKTIVARNQHGCRLASRSKRITWVKSINTGPATIAGLPAANLRGLQAVCRAIGRISIPARKLQCCSQSQRGILYDPMTHSLSKWEVTDCPARVLLIWNGIARGPVQSCNVCREHCDLDCNLW